MTWITALITFSGGALGALARVAVMALWARLAAGRAERYAWVGLLCVNISGCVALGTVEAIIQRNGGLIGLSPDSARWIFTVGLLGGYTSYSAISVFGDRLWRSGRRWEAVGQVAISLALGVPAIHVGVLLGQSLAGGGR